MLDNENLRKTLERIRAREPQALDDFLSQVAPALQRYGLRMCRNEEDAQDVSQESLIAAMRTIESYRGEASISTWLYTIARSFCIKKRRKSKFAPKTETPLHLLETNLLHTEATAHTALHRTQFEAALSGALASMEPSQSEVFVLRDIEGLSAKEVGAVLGISETVVKSRLHRARENVRKKMAPWFESGESGQSEITPQTHPRCEQSREITRLYSKFLEGELAEGFCDSLKSHVATCPDCAPRCDCLKETLRLCGEGRSAAPRLDPKTLEKLKAHVTRCVTP
jgi:RNA polymerase sigma-70 factor (ECF subfamily)